MAVADLDPLLDYWRAQDALFQRVEPAWWGAVVSDARFPAIQEPNYARVETREPVRLAEVEEDLLPAMRRSGSTRRHVVVFHPEDQADLVTEASSRGDRLSWDVVMERPSMPVTTDDRVEEVIAFDPGFWEAHAESIGLFDIDDPDTADQLQALEREVLIPAGRRWFAVRDRGRPVAFAALLVLEGCGFLDHVATFPAHRRRGHAEALTRRALAEASASGAGRTYLLAEPDGNAERVYTRLGFERVTTLVSWLSPLPS
jgi:ribosomal protein S18 acetylase RimI-like enzyme